MLSLSMDENACEGSSRRGSGTFEPLAATLIRLSRTSIKGKVAAFGPFSLKDGVGRHHNVVLTQHLDGDMLRSRVNPDTPVISLGKEGSEGV